MLTPLAAALSGCKKSDWPEGMEPIKWDLKDPQRQTLWGAAAPRSWFEHGSLFAGIEPQEAVLKAQPIIAP